MSALTRLRSDIWVDAYRRRVEIAGGYVTIRQRGATEAGAIVGNLTGGAPEFEFCLAAPPALFNDLRTLLVDADAANA